MTKKQMQKTVQKLVDASFKDGKLLESKIAKSIKILKTLSQSEAIETLSQYLEGVKREERKHTLYIETAVDLTASQVKKVKKVIEKKVKIAKTYTSVNPDVLGGFKIKIGDVVWDETVLGKINQLKEALSGRSNRSN